jgi:nucleoid-associated protein YgaU
MKIHRLALAILLPLSLVYCATTPPGMEGATDPSGASAVSGNLAEELRQARVAIARAAEADAATYDPVTLQEARDALAEGERLQSSDPKAAREALMLASLKANTAYQNALGLAQRALDLQMTDLLEQLRENQVDQFAPDEYADAVSAVTDARDLFAAGRLSDGADTATAAISRMEQLRDMVADQLARVLELKSASEGLMDRIEMEGSRLGADAQVTELQERYEAGKEALDRFALDDAERNFGAARSAGRAALPATDGDGEVTMAQADELMRVVMSELEAASMLDVITDDEIVVEPAPWKGSPYLENGDAGLDAAARDALQALIGAGVEDVPQHALLEHAKELWRLGVDRRNAGEYRLAVNYFERAQRYGAAFAEFAVTQIYTVRLIPERRESLWRIAEYDFIYGNPWLWPKIWHRNRKLIQNPDLIFPGWQLYIPPR